jgi:hypothetical protein
MENLKRRYDRLLVKSKGRKRAIKDMNRFVKHMRKNDDRLTAENEFLRKQVDELSKANLTLLNELEKARLEHV